MNPLLAPLPRIAADQIAPLLFSLHSTQLTASVIRPNWLLLPRRLFLQVARDSAVAPRIVALCGTTGNLHETHAYTAGYFRTEEGGPVRDVTILAAHFISQHAAMTPGQEAAMILAADGSIQEIAPVNGRYFDLKELYQALGCENIDIIEVEQGPYEGWLMVIDDEGKNQGLPINPLATSIWFDTYPLGDYSPVDVVVGPVLLMRSQMMR